MIGTIVKVVRGEGLASAARRGAERIAGASVHAALQAAGVFAAAGHVPVVNISVAGVAPRLGGVQTQLRNRLRAERALRPVALLSPGSLDLSAPWRHMRRIAAFAPASESLSTAFEEAVREALAITGARTIHLEGTSGVPVGSVLRLRESGVTVILSPHDFSLFSAQPHQPEIEHERLQLARELLAASSGLIFPSRFLLDSYRRLSSLPLAEAGIVEPGVPAVEIASGGRRNVVAFAGSVRSHKGAHLLPELIDSLSGGIEWHIFGGGDEKLLQSLRRRRYVEVHGYYRGALPSLLARHHAGLVVLPSTVPESYSLTLSESWLAGVPVAAFDLGAIGERIGRQGGGFLAPEESGAAGLAVVIRRWMAGEISTSVPATVASPEDAATRHVELYRRWGVIE
jgi:glycosyltransferase involved in cell wall biosynthesis